MYNTLTFLDDESDEGDGSNADGKDRTSVDQENKTTEESNENLDNQKTRKSDVNDNPQILKDENQC